MKTLKRVDSGKDRVVVVKKEDLSNAVCSDHQKCVIARAILRATKAEWVDVGASVVLVKRKRAGHLDRFLLHETAKEQVRFFDKEGQFAPCEVLLSAPTQTNRLDYRADRKTGPHNSKYKGRRERLATR